MNFKDTTDRLLQIQKHVNAALALLAELQKPMDPAEILAGGRNQAELILYQVAHFFAVPVHEITSVIRTQEIATARMVFCYYARKKIKNLSLESVGRMINRDHGTVMHAVRAITERRQADKDFDQQLVVLDCKFAALHTIPLSITAITHHENAA